jgi:hypothetical protein
MRTTIWQQWDKQEEARIKRRDQQAAYIKLNNLYLAVESRSVRLKISTANELRVLVNNAYNRNDPMIGYWMREFEKLPNWDNV